MEKDTLRSINDNILTVALSSPEILEVVFAGSIIILLIVWSFLKYRKLQFTKRQIIKDTFNTDFKDITHDWEKTKKLYDILKKKCHPDKFNNDLSQEATRIFQLLVKNKFKYKELLLLKKEAIEKLGISIDDDLI